MSKVADLKNALTELFRKGTEVGYIASCQRHTIPSPDLNNHPNRAELSDCYQFFELCRRLFFDYSIAFFQ